MFWRILAVLISGIILMGIPFFLFIEESSTSDPIEFALLILCMYLGAIGTATLFVYFLEPFL